jgi:hypothetical protein
MVLRPGQRSVGRWLDDRDARHPLSAALAKQRWRCAARCPHVVVDQHGAQRRQRRRLVAQ